MRLNDTIITEQNEVAEAMNNFYINIAKYIGDDTTAPKFSDSPDIPNFVSKCVNHYSIIPA